MKSSIKELFFISSVLQGTGVFKPPPLTGALKLGHHELSHGGRNGNTCRLPLQIFFPNPRTWRLLFFSSRIFPQVQRREESQSQFAGMSWILHKIMHPRLVAQCLHKTIVKRIADYCCSRFFPLRAGKEGVGHGLNPELRAQAWLMRQGGCACALNKAFV